MSDARIYAARFVLTNADYLLENGAIAVENRRVSMVATRPEVVAAYPHVPLTEYGSACVITPGLINAHTHTELTAMRGLLDNVEHDFFKWLRTLTLARRDVMTAEDLYYASLLGAVEAIKSGITCIGDATDSGDTTLRALHDAGLRAVMYQELFGIDETLAASQLAQLKNRIASLCESNRAHANRTRNPYSLIRIGISPHAPYTVSGKLIELVSRYAIDEGLPLMMHAAESTAERALLLNGTGAFADNLKARDIKWQPPRTSTIEYLNARGLLATKPLLAHCITIDKHDLDLITHHDAAIVHCPKSNLKLGHGRAPFHLMLKQNARVGLGSDSVASNNTNDLLEEARFALLLARLSQEAAAGVMFDVVTADVLRAATLGGARALHLEADIGTLEAGKAADFAVFDLSGWHQQPLYDVPAALIAASSGRDCVATVIAGQEVFKNGKVTTVDEGELRRKIDEIKQRLAA